MTVESEPRTGAVDHEALAGRLLRQLRQARGWSMREVAEQMEGYGYHWHQSVIAKIETGQRPLRLNEALDLAALHGVPLTDLVVPPPAGDGSSEAAEREMEALAAAISTAEERAAVAAAAMVDATAAWKAARADVERLRSRMELVTKWHPDLLQTAAQAAWESVKRISDMAQQAGLDGTREEAPDGAQVPR